MQKVVITFAISLLSVCAFSQEFEVKKYKKSIESIGYRWNFERRYKKELSPKQYLFVSPGKYLEMKSYGNELWFKDWQNMNFRILNTETKEEWSKGKSGPGPEGENGQIMFFDKVDEKMFLYDFDKLTFKAFDIDNFVMTSSFQNKEITFYRGTYLRDDRYLMRYDNSLNDHGFSFVIYNAKAKMIEKVFNIANLMGIDQYRDMEMSFPGRFVTSFDRKHIFYFCHLGGVVFKFSQQGDFEFTMQTIDKTPIPQVKNVTTGGGYVPQPELNVDFFLDASANSSHLILLNILEEGEGHVVDLYHAADGTYDYSIHISDYQEQAASLIAADDQGLYVMFEENDIIRYTLR